MDTPTITLSLHDFVEILLDGHREAISAGEELRKAVPHIHDIFTSLKELDPQELICHVEWIKSRGIDLAVVWRKKSWLESIERRERFRSYQEKTTKKYITIQELKHELINGYFSVLYSEVAAVAMVQKLLQSKNKDSILKALNAFSIPVPANIDELLNNL